MMSNLDRWIELLIPESAGYRRRPQQVEMIHAVERALREGKPLLCEAPTGTGKGIGYLIPSLLRVLAHKSEGPHRIAVATSTNALQEQLIEIDLPRLKERFDAILKQDSGFTFAKLIGMNHFVCRERYGKYSASLSKSTHEWFASGDPGQKTDAPKEVPNDELKLLTPEECEGSECDYASRCPYRRHVLQARAANVVVLNHTLLAIGEQSNYAFLGGAPDRYIIDEAHSFEDAARSAWTLEFNTSLIKRLLKRADNLNLFDLDEHAEFRFDQQAGMLSARLSSVVNSRKGHAKQLIRANELDLSEFRALLARVSTAASARIERYAEEIKKALKKEDQERAKTLAKKRRKVQNLGRAVRSKLGAIEIIERGSDEEHAVHVEGDRISCIPLDIGHALAESSLYQNGVILTSATLRDTTGFRAFRRSLGVPSSALELATSAVFDYDQVAPLIVAPHWPNSPDESAPSPTYPRDIIERRQAERRYREYLCACAEYAADLLQGRTLVLCTSWASADMVYAYLTSKQRDYEVLLQPDSDARESRSEIAERFRSNANSVLIGVDSCWTGLDVPGDSLSCAVIERIPYLRPDNPVLATMDLIHPRSGLGRFSAPRAVRKLAQGAGRLIRSEDDRGVVVCCDPRLWNNPRHYAHLPVATMWHQEWAPLIQLAETLRPQTLRVA